MSSWYAYPIHAGGQDFSPSTVSNFVFQNERVLCADILLQDDDIHEDIETFSIAVTSTDSAANLQIRFATVTITDNDGKLLHLMLCTTKTNYSTFSPKIFSPDLKQISIQL